jgi:hypothetical protein
MGAWCGLFFLTFSNTTPGCGVLKKEVMDANLICFNLTEGPGSTFNVLLDYRSNSSDEDEEIWLLLTRHVYNTTHQGGYIALNVKEEEARTHFDASTTKIADEACPSLPIHIFLLTL